MVLAGKVATLLAADGHVNSKDRPYGTKKVTRMAA